MGIRQSNLDVYVVMCTGVTGETCSLGVFSTLEGAKDHVPKVDYSGPMWIEKFRLDDTSFYEEDYVVWKSGGPQ